MLASVISGSLFYYQSNMILKEKIAEIFTCFNEQFITRNKAEIFFSMLTLALFYIILMLLSSTSIIGSLFVYSINFIKISALSIVVTHIYFVYGLRGLEYSLLVILPGKLFLLLSYLIITDACIEITKNIRSVSLKHKSDVKNISVRVVTGVILSTLHVITDYTVLTLFSGLFEF